MPRVPTDADGPSRLSLLRNRALAHVGASYVAWLDDDNGWDPLHLSSLWESTTPDAIAHSERRLFHPDGRPYLEQLFPWGRDMHSRKAIYAYCVAAGIMQPGSNIVRDRMDMRFTWIDLGEWLFPPYFLSDHPFATDYTDWDWVNLAVEDKLLPKAVHQSGLLARSTGQPTLDYYLGGYTNTGTSDVQWRRK